MIRARAIAGVGLLMAALQASVVGAQSAPAPSTPAPSEEARREEARTLGYSGVRAYGSGDYVVASERLERSFLLLPVPSLGLWSARALVQLNKLVEAEQRYRAVAKMRVAADDSGVQSAARETARAELLELLPRIPSVRIQIAGAAPEQVSITLDGTPLPLERWRQGEPVNPGRHQLTGTHAGERALLDLTASEGRESEALLTFAARTVASTSERPPAVRDGATGSGPSSGTSARTWRLGAWLAVGGAGVSLGASALTYFLAKEQQQALDAEGLCRRERCQPSPGLDRYDDLRSVQIVTLVGAFALGAAGAAVFLLEPGVPEALTARSLRLQLGMGSATLSGRF